MLKLIGKKVLNIIPVLFGIVTLVFFIMRLIPGDPAAVLLGDNATIDEVARIRALLGLDRNIFIQYLSYLRSLLSLDLGRSIFQSLPVIDVIMGSFPATLELSLAAMVITLVISLPLGILSAVKQNSPVDYIGMIFAQIGISMPVFWIGLLLILAFSVNLQILPSFGRGLPITRCIVELFTTGSARSLIESLRRLLMPAVSLGIMGSALVSRMIRSTMLEVLESDYVRTARAKGTKENAVIIKHAFRNALLPVVTVVGLQFGSLLGGSIVTETVFAWPGIGRVIVTAISQRDFPLVQGGVICFALAFAIINLLVDMLYMVINPKIRH